MEALEMFFYFSGKGILFLHTIFFSMEGACGMMKETKNRIFPERGEGCATGTPIDV
jgi:uncharacterized membrane protein YkgB